MQNFQIDGASVVKKGLKGLISFFYKEYILATRIMWFELANVVFLVQMPWRNKLMIKPIKSVL